MLVSTQIILSGQEAHNLIPYTAPPFAASPSNYKKPIVLGVEIRRVYGVRKSQFCAGYWRRHNADV